MMDENSSIKQKVNRLSVRQISIILTLVALILWSYSITQAKFVIGDYGIIGGFPILFFISLGILAVASGILWVSKQNEWKLLLLQLCFLVLSLFTAHLMVGAAQPIYYNAVGDMGLMEYIVRTGHILPQTLSLHNWPLNFILHSEIVLFTGINVTQYLNIFPWLPFIWGFLWFFPLFIFFKNTLGIKQPNYYWAALWIFFIADWTGQQNTSASPFGIFCVYWILAELSKASVWQLEITYFKHRIISILSLITITVTHLLSSFVAFALLVGFFISKKIKSGKLIIIISLLIVTWSTLGATSFFNIKLTDLLDQIMKLDQAFQLGIINPLSGNLAHADVSNIRIILSGIIFIIGIIGGIITFRFKRDKFNDVPILIITISCAIIAVIIGSGYRQELVLRFFLYLLPFISYFGIKLLHNKISYMILIICMIIVLPLSFISLHGNQIMNFISPANLSGYFAFHDKTYEGFVDGHMPFGYIKNQEKYIILPTYQRTKEDIKLLVKNSAHVSNNSIIYLPYYICLSNFDRNYEDYFYNKPDLVNNLQSDFEVDNDFNLVFSNSDLVICLYAPYSVLR